MYLSESDIITALEQGLIKAGYDGPGLTGVIYVPIALIDEPFFENVIWLSIDYVKDLFEQERKDRRAKHN